MEGYGKIFSQASSDPDSSLRSSRGAGPARSYRDPLGPVGTKTYFFPTPVSPVGISALPCFVIFVIFCQKPVLSFSPFKNEKRPFSKHFKAKK
jgi:hypothetical protein